MTRVLVTRPEPGAKRTLDALLQLGFEAESISFSEILPLKANLPADDFAASIITSQNALVHGENLRLRFLLKPVFAVGERTAEQLQTLGHQNITWAENVQELLQLLINAAPKQSLYICGKTRKPELEAGMAKANLPFAVAEVYEAAQLTNAAAKLRSFVASSSATIVLFYAQSAVDAFVLALEGRPVPKTFQFLCMSAAIAAQLPETWPNHKIIADQPNDTSMLHQLHKLLA